ncbi:MAG: AAA family ATPase [Nitrospinota bacterium]|nr:AAA family ATPase [Nitrospinota bacterium]
MNSLGLKTIEDGQPPSGIMSQVRAIIEAEGISQGAVAREVGLSPSTLSQWLHGQYRGDISAVEGRLARWLADRLESGETKEGALIDTQASKQILQTLNYAIAFPSMVVILGEPGTGKTVSMKKYINENKGAVYVGLTVLNKGVSQFMQRLSDCLGRGGCSISGSRSYRLFRDIVEHIEDKKVRLLIVDEAQHLSLPALEAARGLFDETGVSVALAGNEYILHRMTSGPQSAAFTQLYSRVARYVRLSITKGDIGKLAAIYSVRGQRIIETLEQTARLGGLRSVHRTLRLAATLAKAEGCDIEKRHLEEAITLITGG